MNNQDTEGHQAIKIFPYEGQDSRFSNFLALSTQDAAVLICGLQDEVKRLQEDRERDREEIDSLRSQIASVDKQREKEFSLLNEHLVKALVRVSILERELKTKKAAPTEKTQPHLDKMAAHLGEKRKRGVPALMGFREAAQVTGLTKQRISQLRPAIEADRRFTLQSRGKKLYIGLHY